MTTQWRTKKIRTFIKILGYNNFSSGPKLGFLIFLLSLLLPSDKMTEVKQRFLILLHLFHLALILYSYHSIV